MAKRSTHAKKVIVANSEKGFPLSKPQSGALKEQPTQDYLQFFAHPAALLRRAGRPYGPAAVRKFRAELSECAYLFRNQFIGIFVTVGNILDSGLQNGKLPSHLKALSLILSLVSNVDRLRLAKHILDEIDRQLAQENTAEFVSVLRDVEAIIADVVGGKDTLENLLRDRDQQKFGCADSPPQIEDGIVIDKNKFPKWDPDELLSWRHWQKYYEPHEVSERPTLGQLDAYDKPFLKALREAARKREIAMTSLLVVEEHRKPGRKIKPLTAEEALAKHISSQERNRLNQKAFRDRHRKPGPV